MYNAFQPGVFALSGWDLVGALPLNPTEVQDLMSDGDTRWIERGAYDLTGQASDQAFSPDGIPRARCLYGSICEQLEEPDSFASQLKRLLAVRESYGLAASHQTHIPDVSAAGLLVMVHVLPNGRGTQVTALNFSAEAIEEIILLTEVPPGPVVDMIAETIVGDLHEDGALTIKLSPYEGLSLRIVSASPSL